MRATLGPVALAVAIFCATVLTSAGDQTAARATAAAVTTPDAVPPADYVIGVGDLLSIKFWGDDDDEQKMNADVVVRPDGRISLRSINDIQAGGRTPEELRQRITQEAVAKNLYEDPRVSVQVKEIKSRQVFITGEIERPNAYALNGPMTVLQLIAMAGGLKEYAKRDQIVILRTEGGRETSIKFNYKEVGKSQKQVYLQPGDQVLVP